MKKVLLAVVLVIGVYILASIKAESAYATVLYGAIFKNSDGQVPLTVYYRIQDASGYVTLSNGQTTSWSPQIGAGQQYAMADQSNTGFTGQGSYTLTWWTDCADPDVPALYASLAGQTGVAYWGNGSYANGLKVHAENPCGEPVITTTSGTGSPTCTLTFSWQMTGRAAGLPYNVERYHFFRSQAPDTNP